jgi:hypothetical protein
VCERRLVAHGATVVQPLRSNPLRRWLGAFACLLGVAALPAFADDASSDPIDYRLGSGVQVPGTGFTFGGYATGSYTDPEGGAAHANLDNVSLFIWWEGDSRWKFFAEIEYENFAVTRGTTGGKDDYLSLERLYADYALNDALSLRFGKFLTPIGRWNLVHATPLVWTTSRPLTTYVSFPTNMTGVMATGSLSQLANGLEYSFYAAGTDDLRPNPDQDPFTAAFGAHASLPLSQFGQVGVSYADFEQQHTRPERKQIVGIDYLWSRNRFEISAEGIYRFSDDNNRQDEKGAFIQLVAPLSDRLYAVGRAEAFRSDLEPRTTQLRVLGLTFKILPTLVLKAEWIDSTHNTIHVPDGFMSSISILL